ncbi:MAG: HEPN domain-containing protein [Isosphaerales bacterium]
MSGRPDSSHRPPQPHCLDRGRFQLLQRLEDAEILFRNERTTGAIYLAGYAVECVLKAVLLAISPHSEHQRIVKSIHGKIAYDIEWLREA